MTEISRLQPAPNVVQSLCPTPLLYDTIFDMQHIKQHWIVGTVVHGDGRGHELGFPTANLRLEDERQRPEDGIWAAWAKVADSSQTLKAVMHIGPRPTIPNADATVEVHLLEIEHIDLYGQKVSFSPVRKLRGVEKFKSMDDLADAIAGDCRDAMIVLKDRSPLL